MLPQLPWRKNTRFTHNRHQLKIPPTPSSQPESFSCFSPNRNHFRKKTTITFVLFPSLISIFDKTAIFAVFPQSEYFSKKSSFLQSELFKNNKFRSFFLPNQNYFIVLSPSSFPQIKTYLLLAVASWS